METSKKIKKWARIGQVSFWLYIWFLSRYERQLPMQRVVHSETVKEAIYTIISILMVVLFSEAIVRVIGYLAELLDK